MQTQALDSLGSERCMVLLHISFFVCKMKWLYCCASYSIRMCNKSNTHVHTYTHNYTHTGQLLPLSGAALLLALGRAAHGASSLAQSMSV